MEKLSIIKDLYFIQKKSLTEIADIVNTSISYISKILRKDKRYTNEKENRKKETLIKRREKQKDIIYSNRKNKLDANEINMKKLHEQDVNELSKHCNIGTQALRKWCSSAYKYNPKKKCYEFDIQNLNKSIDLPLYIKA